MAGNLALIRKVEKDYCTESKRRRQKPDYSVSLVANYSDLQIVVVYDKVYDVV